MKSFNIFLLSIIFIVFSVIVLAGANKYKATDNEELFGTWVNMGYTDGMTLFSSCFHLPKTNYLL